VPITAPIASSAAFSAVVFTSTVATLFLARRRSGILQWAKVFADVAKVTASTLGAIFVARRGTWPVIAIRSPSSVRRTTAAAFPHLAQRRGKLHEFVAA
jgi:hypothetical protein